MEEEQENPSRTERPEELGPKPDGEATECPVKGLAAGTTEQEEASVKAEPDAPNKGGEPGARDGTTETPADDTPTREEPPGTPALESRPAKGDWELSEEEEERLLAELKTREGTENGKTGLAVPGDPGQGGKGTDIVKESEEEGRPSKTVPAGPKANGAPEQKVELPAIPEGARKAGQMKGGSRLGVALALMVGVLPPFLIVLGYAFRLHFQVLLLYSFTWYGILTLTHVLLQMVFASRELRSASKDPGFKPAVSVIIPVFNEDAVIFDKCLKSLRDQAKLDLEVIIANDGSKPYIRELFEKRKGPKWVFLDLPHKGKRDAMYAGFKQATGDILIFGDSDTLFERNCFYQLVQPFTDPNIGATTGNVRIYNNQPWLAKLSDFRYWIAFNLERAAQSRFGVMSCVSGPCGAYRRDVLERVIDAWRDQTFLGKKCTYGDDRNLTNLVLLEGFRTKYVVSAHSRTLFPPTAGQWVRQQLRWSRSFYREYIVNIRSFHKHSAWLPYDLTYQALFPIFVGFNIIFVLLNSMFFDYRFLFLYFMLIVIFAFIRSLYGMMMTGKAGFLSLVAYGFIYVIILLPLKLYALVTLWKVGWGTAPRNDFKTDYTSKQDVLSFW